MTERERRIRDYLAGIEWDPRMSAAARLDFATAKVDRELAQEAERREADAAGVTLEKLHAARAELRARERATAAVEELERARHYLATAGEATVADGRMSLSKAEVLDARRGWQRGEGPDYKLAGVTKRSYIRARHRYGLVPWPSDYRGKMTPRTG